MPPVVEAVDLHRSYKTTTGSVRRRSLEVEAVRGVSFEIGQESCSACRAQRGRQDNDDQDADHASDPDVKRAGART